MSSEAEQMALDQEAKLQIVLHHIQANCREDSEHEDIRTIHAALQAGDKLCGQIVSGGWTNYSYQIYLEKKPDIRLFAKACFAFALWCPGDDKPYYDLDRVTVEFDIMKRFVQEMGGPEMAPIATPYFLLDVSDDFRILVAKWATADEQFANQFIEGQVDPRIPPQVARALAATTLALVDDPNLNQHMKKNLNEMLLGPFDEEFAKLYNKPPKTDACIEYMNEIGKERFDTIMNAMRAADDKKECLVHSDPHVVNMLVEGKPDITHMEEFGPQGAFILCDWEMAHVGPKGKDIGLYFSVPLACAYFHRAQGHMESSESILKGLDDVWNDYSKYLLEGGKDQSYLTESYRAMIGFIGWRYFNIFYVIEKQIDLCDNEGLTADQVKSIVAKVGITGIKMMESAFLDDAPAASYNLDQLMTLYKTAVAGDLTAMAEINFENERAPRPSRRRSSVLRATGRRVSDAGMMEAALRRLSLMEKDE